MTTSKQVHGRIKGPKYLKGKFANRLYKIWRKKPLAHLQNEAVVSAENPASARMLLVEQTKDYTWANLKDVEVEIISRESLVYKHVVVVK